MDAAGMGRRNDIASGGGFTLLEVLITVLVLSIGMLGLAALHLSSIRGTRDAYLQSQAVALSYQLTDAMRANRGAAQNGAYDTAFDDTAADLSCSGGGSVANSDLCMWKQAMEARLPGARGYAAVHGGTSVATVCVFWKEPSEQADRRIAVSNDNCGTLPSGDGGRVFEVETVL